MNIDIKNSEDYIQNIVDENKKEAIIKLRDCINASIPKGFEEQISYGMIAWVVPFSLYPAGYHCNPKLPLPFLSIAAQKNFIALYHMGIYSDTELKDWFVTEYKKNAKSKLDMGKSCIRFKKTEDIPYSLIGKLATKITPEKWIASHNS